MTTACIANERNWDIYAEGGPTFVVGPKPTKARKRHVCGECGREIQPGQSYWFERGVNDGCWYSWKECVPCHEIRGMFCEDVQSGNLHDDVREFRDQIGICHLDGLSPETVDRLINWADLDGEEDACSS